MGVSVIDTRREFKLVPYSGDDEQWGHSGFSSLRLGANWSVGDDILDVASQSTHPIANTDA